MIAYLKKLSYYQLLILATTLSVVFSILELLPQNPIDTDAIRYVWSAQAYMQSGWHAAVEIYKWPFFPIMGAWLDHITGLGLPVCFHFINTLLQALLVVCFIVMVKELGGDTRCQRWAAVVILIYPLLNSLRVYATRDSGYWAFGLLAVCFLLRFMRQADWRYAIAWSVAMLIATLFRIEGIIMLAAAPLAVLCQPHQTWSKRIQHFLTLNIVLVFVMIVAFFWHMTHHQVVNQTRLHELFKQVVQIVPHLIHTLQLDAGKLRVAILNGDSEENAMTILSGGLTLVYIMDILNVVRPLNFLLACFGQKQGLISNRYGQVYLLYWLMMVNAIMLAIFVMERYFLSTRYPVFMVLLWMAWIPFSLQYLHQKWHEKTAGFLGNRWLWPALVIGLIWMAAGGLIRFGYSKTYITHSGQWLYQHSVSTHSKLNTNTYQVAFYATNGYTDLPRVKNVHVGYDLDYESKHICEYDWWALRVNKKDQLPFSVQQFMATHAPVKIFENKRHDRVLVYQTKDFCS